MESPHPAWPSPRCLRRRLGRWVCVLALLAAAPALWFVVRTERAWRQQEEVRAIRQIDGCQVAYDGEDVYSPEFHFDGPPPLPPVSWTEALLGKDFVHRAGTVGLPALRADEVTPHLKRLPYLRRVVVLKTDDVDNERVEAAANRIRQELPDIETVMLEFDFDIRDNSADQ